jgi:hypothetical protein
MRRITSIGFAASDAIHDGATGGQDGRPMSLNDDGVLAFRLDFDDGPSGIFTAAVVVPEPASAALLLAVAAPAALRRRRRFR